MLRTVTEIETAGFVQVAAVIAVLQSAVAPIRLSVDAVTCCQILPGDRYGYIMAVRSNAKCKQLSNI